MFRYKKERSYMSILFIWHMLLRVRARLSLCVQSLAHPEQSRAVDHQRVQQEQVRLVAQTLMPMMNIWQITSSCEVKAHIACWHRLVESYRGYLLYADSDERTFLVDSESRCYVTLEQMALLQIDGLAQAKQFLDVLCQARQQKPILEFNTASSHHR